MKLDNINKKISKVKKSANTNLDFVSILKGIDKKEIFSISKALTLVESQKNEHEIASFLTALKKSDKSLRIAVTGPPGAGKSTFIESLGMQFIEKGLTVAVLAVDPSSQISKGSILGDKTRMERLSKEKNAFIRPSPNNLDLGGIRKSTFNSIKICEAAGFDIILVETVGVGQSELEVSQITDIFVLLLTPTAGDELQGIKKGIVEKADIILINKSDGNLISNAQQIKREYQQAIKYLKYTDKIFEPVLIEAISSTEEKGITRLANLFTSLITDSAFQDKKIARRHVQEQQWFVKQSQEIIHSVISSHPKYNLEVSKIKNDLRQEKIDLYQALDQLKKFLLTNFAS